MGNAHSDDSVHEESGPIFTKTHALGHMRLTRSKIEKHSTPQLLHYKKMKICEEFHAKMNELGVPTIVILGNLPDCNGPCPFHTKLEVHRSGKLVPLNIKLPPPTSGAADDKIIPHAQPTVDDFVKSESNENPLDNQVPPPPHPMSVSEIRATKSEPHLSQSQPPSPPPLPFLNEIKKNRIEPTSEVESRPSPPLHLPFLNEIRKNRIEPSESEFNQPRPPPLPFLNEIKKIKIEPTSEVESHPLRPPPLPFLNEIKKNRIETSSEVESHPPPLPFLNEIKKIRIEPREIKYGPLRPPPLPFLNEIKKIRIEPTNEVESHPPSPPPLPFLNEIKKNRIEASETEFRQPRPPPLPFLNEIKGIKVAPTSPSREIQSRPPVLPFLNEIKAAKFGSSPDHPRARGTRPPPPPPVDDDLKDAILEQEPSVALPKKKFLTSKHEMPALNWSVIRPFQMEGTVFEKLDEQDISNKLNFEEFERLFKRSAANKVDVFSAQSNKMNQQSLFQTFLTHQRQRQVGAILFNLRMAPVAIIEAVAAMDYKTLTPEKLDILCSITPNAEEVETYNQYLASGKSMDKLSKEDLFMCKLSRSDRLAAKIRVMQFICKFPVKKNIYKQFVVVLKASESLLKSNKFRQILEIVLAYGNYMNGEKRGLTFGFKLESLTMLSAPKSADRQMCLLEYIVRTIKSKLPQIDDFDSELEFISEAAVASPLESLIKDLQELDRGVEMVRREIKLCKSYAQTSVPSFLKDAETKMKHMQVLAKESQKAFTKCQTFFGETNVKPSEFFGILDQFIKSYRKYSQSVRVR